MKKKREFRLFTIVDYEKEEEYLRYMHQNGWKFIGYRYGFFHFEECQPEDVVYGIDFKEKRLDDEYLQLFEDAGWEYISTCLSFVYFRKKAEDFLPEEDRQIYSDALSRVEMVDTIVRRRLAAVLAGFTACLYLIINIFRESFSVFQLFDLLLCAVYIYLLLRVGRGYYKLRKKYEP